MGGATGEEGIGEVEGWNNGDLTVSLPDDLQSGSSQLYGKLVECNVYGPQTANAVGWGTS